MSQYTNYFIGTSTVSFHDALQSALASMQDHRTSYKLKIISLAIHEQALVANETGQGIIYTIRLKVGLDPWIVT